MGGSDDHDWSFVRRQSRTERDVEAERRRWREESRKRRVEAGEQRRRERDAAEAMVRAELERRFFIRFRNHPWIDDPDAVPEAFSKFEREERANVINDLGREKGWDRRYQRE